MLRLTKLAALAVLLPALATADVVDEQATEQVDERKPLVVVSPTYPAKAWQQRRQGRVIVCFKIRADGSTANAYVLASSSRIFNKPALKAVRRSTYENSESNSAADEACRTFRFTLEPDTRSPQLSP